MKFFCDKPGCQNIRTSLRKEWLVTNNLGDYASSTVPGCHTRKYHGLLVANLAEPAGRHVLLSTLEESILAGEREFFLSTRKHPGVYHPKGHEYLEAVEIDGRGEWPVCRYRVGQLGVTKEILLARDAGTTLIRYAFNFPEGYDGTPPLLFRIKPLLAFRHMHALTRENDALDTRADITAHGVRVRPYAALPPLFLRLDGARFEPAPDWFRNVVYTVEEERGFPNMEDLFMPGVFTLALTPGTEVVLAASLAATTGDPDALWAAEGAKRAPVEPSRRPVQDHLRREGRRFLINLPPEQPASPPAGIDDARRGAPGVTAGYHWFDVWGRDSLIALPGLTFAAGRADEGEAVLAAISATAKNGLIPNMFGRGDTPPSYNSVDASLWYAWAVQQMLIWSPGKEPFARAVCWPVIKDMVRLYRGNASGLPLRTDEEGMLHAGNAQTQLTWMDATANGAPVTPRHGCPVEINALWYNALAFCDELAARYAEPEFRQPDLWRMRTVFRHRFWTPREGGHLGDVWRDGDLDRRIRPNQIFAVSLPYPVLDQDDQPFVVESVRNNLLTPYGLRTLSPRSSAYQGCYEGSPDQRDAAYHQGTVWPWLLGAYGEAMLKTAWDVDGAARGLLDTLTPLFSDHLAEAGLGSISEIFDGNPPHEPNGCIAQAWSVAECFRLLRLLEKAAPRVYDDWESQLATR